MFEKLRKKNFQVVALHHAEAILKHDMPAAIQEIEEVLDGMTLPMEHLIKGGGGEAQSTQDLRRHFERLGWRKHEFEIRKIVDGEEKESISHEIDHVKVFNSSTFALEIEWNNKDPFFDRDLENFKRLHAEGAISIGAIITRGNSLHESMRELVADFARARGIDSILKLSEYYDPTRRQVEMIEKAADKVGTFADGWARAFVSDKFGEATTHWRKLEDRVRRGVGNPCPLLLIGVPKDITTI